jgi:transcriptional regulator with XRE-family HTH domain
MNAVAKSILILRERAGLSQDKLAELSGLSRTYISLIERGVAVNVSRTVEAKLAKALNTTTGALSAMSTVTDPRQRAKDALAIADNWGMIRELSGIIFELCDLVDAQEFKIAKLEATP